MLHNALDGDRLVVDEITVTDLQIKLQTKARGVQVICTKFNIHGRSSIIISGTGLIVSGIFITGAGGSEAEQIVDVKGEGAMLVNSVIDGYKGGKDTDWVRLRSPHQQLICCSLLNKVGPGLMCRVDASEGSMQKIRHCLFENFVRTTYANGQETLRIGVSKDMNSSSQVVVDGCTFRKCDGEIEVVSVKTCRNIISNCSFIDCDGWLTLRHGNSNTVTSCTFSGCTGGIRVYDANHIIEHCSFTRIKKRCIVLNKAKEGDAGHVEATNTLVQGCTFTDNECDPVIEDKGRGNKIVLDPRYSK